MTKTYYILEVEHQANDLNWASLRKVPEKYNVNLEHALWEKPILFTTMVVIGAKFKVVLEELTKILSKEKL